MTVRTTHHYHEIGLLVPSGRSGAGYRLYSEGDLERLYQILLYRELGFPLEAIGNVIDDPAMDRRSALRAQRGLLVEKRRKADAVIRAVDRLLDTMEKGTKMSRDEMIEGFDAFADAPQEIRDHQAQYGPEAKERWGDSDAYRESMRRTRGYNKADWKKVQDEAEATEARMAELLAAGADPEGPEAMDGAEAMRLHIGRWFLLPVRPRDACRPGRHVHGGPALRRTLRQARARLAAFVAAAIRANARRAQA